MDRRLEGTWKSSPIETKVSAKLKASAFITMMFAVALELLGTVGLKLADGTRQPGWYLLVAAGYGGAFYFFSWAVRTIPIRIAYAVWAGLGIVGTAAMGSFFFKQHLSAVVITGILVIMLGIVLVNLGSIATDASR